MKLFKKSVPKDFIPASETPTWAMGSIIYGSLKR